MEGSYGSLVVVFRCDNGGNLFCDSSWVGFADLSAQWRVLCSIQRGSRARFDQDLGQLRVWQEGLRGILLKSGAVGVIRWRLRARSTVLAG